MYHVPTADHDPNSEEKESIILHFYTAALCRYASYYLINSWYKDYCKNGNSLDNLKYWYNEGMNIIPIIDQ